jgi:hypothetical protein
MAHMFAEAEIRMRLEDPKAVKRALVKFPQLNAMVEKDIAKLMVPSDFDKFIKHMQKSQLAVQKLDWAAFSYNMEEGMLLTRPLFLSKKGK